MAKSKAPNKGQTDRRAARLAAVQALYQCDMNDPDPRQVVAEFVTHRADELGDRGLFGDVVNGVADRVEDIDRMISESLAEGWTIDRLETVLRAIMRAGAYELLAKPDVPPRVVINEYVEIAHAFFAGREPGMVNGVLDRLARVLRAESFERPRAS